METYTFDDLVQSLEGRRRVGEEPPVLLLGAGASASAGLATMRRLYEADGIAADAPDAFEQFCKRMRKRDDRERFRWLAAHLQQRDAEPVTPGYRALAALCAQHIFDVVLTANLDPLLEDAFTATQLRRRDYLVLINGVLRVDRLPLLLLPGAPRVKVLKLHGDLFHRFMAWTPEEMNAYLRDITMALAKSLTMRDVMVVGYSLRDPAVRELALGTGGTVWFANPGPPAAEITDVFAKHNVRVITSPQCAFETLFTSLAAALGVPVSPEEQGAAPPVLMTPSRIRRTRGTRKAIETVPVKLRTAGNLDEVQAATVGILAVKDGPVLFTGFLLANPRVIVTDGWNADQFLGRAADGILHLVTQSGERLQTRRVAVVDGNPFGPMTLEAPETLGAAGLRLDVTPLAANEPIDVAVGTNVRRAIMEGAMTVEGALAQKLIDKSLAAELRRHLKQRKKSKPAEKSGDEDWQRFAISHGRVHTGDLRSIRIEPIGQVDQMLRLDLAVAPGCSGAAVVDATCAVRGFIVAGAPNPEQPESYALPASWWGPRLPKK